jgi:hypothetical protein
VAWILLDSRVFFLEVGLVRAFERQKTEEQAKDAEALDVLAGET